MFAEIDAMLKVIQEKRTVSQELTRSLSQKFREDWIYHSNAIEGNTFTLQETAFFLREGLTIKGKTLREHLEVVNHAEAIEYLHDSIRQRDLTEGLIKEFQQWIFLYKSR